MQSSSKRSLDVPLAKRRFFSYALSMAIVPAAILAAALVSQTSSGPALPTLADCLTEPLQLQWGDYTHFGKVARIASEHHCAAYKTSSPVRYRPGQSLVVGRTHIAGFRLFGRKLGLNLDVVLVSGAIGMPDNIYATPAWDLPDDWERTIVGWLS